MDLHAGKAGLARDNCGVGPARDQIVDFNAGERMRHAELPARQRQRHCRRRPRMGIDALLGLASGVTDLHPGLRIASGGRRSPARPGRFAFVAEWPIDNHIARPFQMAAMNLHIARDQQPAAAIGPAPIQRFMGGNGQAIAKRQPFRHSRLGDAVAEVLPVRQAEGFVDVWHACTPDFGSACRPNGPCASPAAPLL